MRTGWSRTGWLALFLCLDVLAQNPILPPQPTSAESTAPPQEREILYLVPAGHQSAAARVYLYELCRWIAKTPSIRSRYSIVYVSSRLERPLDAARADLSDGTDVRRPAENRNLSEEDQQLAETLETARTLLQGSNSLWDVRGKLSQCYGAYDKLSPAPSPHSMKATVLIAELVDLGAHGSGLSFVKVSSKAKEQAKYDFVRLTASDYLGAVRLLAAGALRPEGMAVAQVNIHTAVKDGYECTPSAAAAVCLLQAGSAQLTVDAADSPFVLASQVSLPDINTWSFSTPKVMIENVRASREKVELTVRFTAPGLYKLKIPVNTQLSAAETVTDIHELEFEVRTQPLILEASQLVVASFSGRYWGHSFLDLGLSPSLRNTLKPQIESWRVMPASEIDTLASRIEDTLKALAPPKIDAPFISEWERSMEVVINHDTLRALLSREKKVTVGSGNDAVTFTREKLWCETVITSALALMQGSRRSP